MEDQELKMEIISNSQQLESIIRAETDVAINTAKMYPRNIQKCIADAEAMATLDEETAAGCFYALNKGGSPIEGPSVRLAEIMVYSMGNIKAGYRIIANDGKKITAQAVCHDLEKNVSITAEVQRRITNKQGQTFSEDMQIVTGNAAGSIAFRNAVFKVIPMALTKNIYEKAKKVAIGEGMTMTKRRENAFKFFKSLGVGEDRVLAVLKRQTIDDVNAQDMGILLGLKTAITNGDQQANEAFPPTNAEVNKANVAKKSEAAMNSALKTTMKNSGKNGKGTAVVAEPEPNAPETTADPAQSTEPTVAREYHYVLEKELAIDLDGEPVVCEAGTEARYINGSWEIKGFLVSEEFIKSIEAFKKFV